MRINEQQLKLVDRQIKRLVGCGNFYGTKLKEAGIGGVLILEIGAGRPRRGPVEFLSPKSESIDPQTNYTKVDETLPFNEPYQQITDELPM